MTDVLELYIIEIPKAREILKKEPKNELAQWVMFLNDPNESEVSQIVKENNEIKEAMDELEKISKDEELRIVAELREKAIRDKKNGLRHAREEGIKEGIEQGIEQGVKRVAKKMLATSMPIKEIIKITGLTEEQILKLK